MRTQVTVSSWKINKTEERQRRRIERRRAHNGRKYGPFSKELFARSRPSGPAGSLASVWVRESVYFPEVSYSRYTSTGGSGLKNAVKEGT